MLTGQAKEGPAPFYSHDQPPAIRGCCTCGREEYLSQFSRGGIACSTSLYRRREEHGEQEAEDGGIQGPQLEAGVVTHHAYAEVFQEQEQDI